MDDIELEKETYEKVVSLIRSGKNAKALKAILPEANDDAALAGAVFDAIEKSLKRGKESSPKKEKDSDQEEKKEGTVSPEPGNPPTTSILLPSEPTPRRERKAAILGDHKGINEVDLEKETFLRVVELIKAEEREQALDLIFEEANQNRNLAKQVLRGIERSLLEEPKAEDVILPATAPVSPSKKSGKPKEEKKRPVAEPPHGNPLPIDGEVDPIEKAKREIRHNSRIVWIFGGILGYWFFRSGMRPLKAILTNFAICLVVGLVVGYFILTNHSNGELAGSDPADQETLNYVAVAMCPLLAEDLDLHAGQRNFCSVKRKRFAYFLYEESRKIDGSDTIGGPFSEETLQAALYILGKQIKGQLNGGQRNQFLKLYETGQWEQVDIVEENGRLRLEYPKYGNVPGILRLSVASRE